MSITTPPSQTTLPPAATKLFSMLCQHELIKIVATPTNPRPYYVKKGEAQPGIPGITQFADAKQALTAYGIDYTRTTLADLKKWLDGGKIGPVPTSMPLTSPRQIASFEEAKATEPARRLDLNETSTFTSTPSSSHLPAPQTTGDAPQSRLDALRQRWIGREDQVVEISHLLLNLAMNKMSFSCLCYGLANTGKTSVVKSALETLLESKFVYVDMLECCGKPKELFSILCQKISNLLPSHDAVHTQQTTTTTTQPPPPSSQTTILALRQERLKQNAAAMKAILANMVVMDDHDDHGETKNDDTTTHTDNTNLAPLPKRTRRRREYTALDELYLDCMDCVSRLGCVCLVIDGAQHSQGASLDMWLSLVATCKISGVGLIIVSRSINGPMSRSLQATMDSAHVDVKIEFPPYPMATMTRLLVTMPGNVPLDCPSSKYYEFFVDLVVDQFKNQIQDLGEMAYVLRSLWPVYYGAIRNGSTEYNNTRSAMANMAPMMNALSRRLHTRVIVSHQELVGLKPGINNADLKLVLDKLENDREVVWKQLPLCGKVLLMACYFASYNPKSLDDVVFTKAGDGKKRKKTTTKKKKTKSSGSHVVNASSSAAAAMITAEPPSQLLIGPKAFSMSRAVRIGKFLMERLEKDELGPLVVWHDIVQHQFCVLESQGLLSKTSVAEELNKVKYKCMASHALVKAIGQNIGLPVDGYLRLLNE